MKFDMRVMTTLAVPIGIVGIIMLLVFPLQPWMMDVFLTMSIMLSMIALLTTMFVKKPLEFSVFPTLVLVAALFRLALNVASTRLILSPGSGGGEKAGKVIESFGTFVVGGNFIVGMVVFVILVIINFVVITNGAGRVAEVGARFTLDAMPGKQMAIDADLNSGLIDEATARARRAEIAAEADFYGAMDGGSKFVKGDAIAGIIITLVNLIAGFIMGMVVDGMTATDAISTYSQLTVGDGLVSQIPSLLMSLATGVIVTRSKDSDEGGIGGDFSKQLTQSFLALFVAGVASILMGLIPSMPKLPFMVVGALLIYGGWMQMKKLRAAELEREVTVEEEDEIKPAGETQEQLIEQMRVPALEILLAPDLIDLVGANTDTDLLARVRGLRRKVALESGFVLPPVRTRDSVDLPVSTYVIRMSGVEVGRGVAPPGKILALGGMLDDLPGELTNEPVFGLSGKWIPVELRYNAELNGATVVDRVSVLITHLGALVSENASRLLSREDVRVLVDGVRQTNPSAVEELIPQMLSLGEVQVVLQGLLEEQVPILDLPRIFEALSVKSKQTTDPEQLIEAARAELGPAIVAKYMMEGVLRVITLDPLFEQSLLESVRPGDEGSQLALDPDRMETFLNQTREATEQAEQTGYSVVLVCAPVLRPALRKLVNLGIARLPVLSYTEVSGAKVMIETMGTISGSHAISG